MNHSKEIQEAAIGLAKVNGVTKQYQYWALPRTESCGYEFVKLDRLIEHYLDLNVLATIWERQDVEIHNTSKQKECWMIIFNRCGPHDNTLPPFKWFEGKTLQEAALLATWGTELAQLRIQTVTYATSLDANVAQQDASSLNLVRV